VIRRTNAEWIAALRLSGSEYETALQDLREIILARLPSALDGWLASDSPQASALVEEVAQDTLLKVLGHLDTFEGRSQFTTWVYKIAAHTALTELRHRRWKDVSLEDLLEREDQPVIPAAADTHEDPEVQVMQSDLLIRLWGMICEELTDRQLLVVKLVAIHGLPVEETARQVGMERNALYKMLHDARLRLKHRLAREGLEVSEVLAVFEQE
jgi:RNA polymerase sigma-70 factor, ECF subfamily